MNMYDFNELAEEMSKIDAENADDINTDLYGTLFRNAIREEAGGISISVLGLQPRDRRTIFMIVTKLHLPESEAAQYLTGVDFGITLALVLQKLGRLPFSQDDLLPQSTIVTIEIPIKAKPDEYAVGQDKVDFNIYRKLWDTLPQ